MNKPWVFALTLCAATALLSCTSAPSTPTVQPAVPPASQDNKVAAVTTQQPAKPAHRCVMDELSQMYVEDIVRMSGAPSASLHYCFVSGYQGIDCGDNWEITHAMGHLSNRERAECDAIMRRFEEGQAFQKARKKQLDEDYDKEHGLTPKYRPAETPYVPEDVASYCKTHPTGFYGAPGTASGVSLFRLGPPESVKAMRGAPQWGQLWDQRVRQAGLGIKSWD